MALIGKPPLVILSNPLAGVDPSNKRKLIKTIKTWTEGRSLLMSTMNVDEAELIGDKVAIMHQGKLLAVGSVGEIIETHGEGYTLEIQADCKRLKYQATNIKETNDVIFKNSAEAALMLDRIVETLDKKQEIKWAGLRKEFSKTGLLKDLFKEINQKGGYHVDKFISHILVLNLAFTLIDAMLDKQPSLDMNIVFAHADLLRISVKPDASYFNLADFTEYV
jgi:ABC-type multidrug transport system ATPase subunit